MNNPTPTPEFVPLELQEAINNLAEIFYANAVDKGFHTSEETEDQFIERSCNNAHDEVSELHTAWRNGDLHKPCDKATKMVEAGILPLTCLEEELADIFIRCLDSAAKLNVNIGIAVATKHAFNRTRPHKHGNKKS